MRKVLLPVLGLMLVTSSAAVAQSKTPVADTKAQLIENLRVSYASAIEPQACTKKTITCGQTLQGNLGSSGCVSGSSNADFYTFTGTENQQIAASLTTSVFTPFLTLVAPDGTILDSSSIASGPGTVQLSSGLPSAGTWALGVSNSGSPSTGAYSVTLTCPSGQTTCIENNETLCIGNGRFQVKATFNAGASGSGNAQAVALTSDTGYLWFFSASNVETVVKVINGCGLNNHYWVFAGGLTNVNVVMTVTDLQTNTTKTYTNPANTEYQPIEDTSAFATCP